MGKENGKLFSKSLFGYRCKDVVEYIRTVDASHDEELSRLNSEIEILEDKLIKTEISAKTAEDLFAKERQSTQDMIKNASLEHNKEVAELNNTISTLKDKIADSESRASSYLKLVDSTSLRAETAEAELAVLSAALEELKNEVSDLKSKLAEKDAEIKRVTELETLAKKLIEADDQKKQNDLPAILSIFKKSRRFK